MPTCAFVSGAGAGTGQMYLEDHRSPEMSLCFGPGVPEGPWQSEGLGLFLTPLKGSTVGTFRASCMRQWPADLAALPK